MFGTPWSDPYYFNTAVLIGGMILICAVLLYPFRRKHPSTIAAWASIKSWIFAGPILFFIIGLPHPWPLVGVTVGVIFCAKEFFQITGMYHRSMFVWLVYIGIMVQSYCVYRNFLDLYDLMPMIVTALIMLIPLLRNNYKFMVQYMALSAFNFIFMGWGMLHMERILLLPQGHLHLIYIIILSEVADYMALGMGRLLGKTIVFDRISSKRTLEGSAAACLLTFGIAYYFRDIFEGVSDIHWIVAGGVAFVAGSLGDMALTVIRRDLGVKDMGVFIWGRGGILDLMDRMIFVAPLYYYSLEWLKRGFP